MPQIIVLPHVELCPEGVAIQANSGESICDVLLANQPQKKFVQVEQLAALAVFLCRDEASAITGTNLSVDGGWTAQ